MTHLALAKVKFLYVLQYNNTTKYVASWEINAGYYLSVSIGFTVFVNLSDLLAKIVEFRNDEFAFECS